MKNMTKNIAKYLLEALWHAVLSGGCAYVAVFSWLHTNTGNAFVNAAISGVPTAYALMMGGRALNDCLCAREYWRGYRGLP